MPKYSLSMAKRAGVRGILRLAFKVWRTIYSPRLRFSGRPYLQQAVKRVRKIKQPLYKSPLYEVERGAVRSTGGVSHLTKQLSRPVLF